MNHDLRTHGMVVGLSRRSVLGLAALAPFAALPARASELVNFTDISVADDQYTDRARNLAGAVVEMRGYMAPPLKPEIDFFVLTSLPTAICPFCDAAASWPDDIVLVKLSRPVHALAYDRLLNVSGVGDRHLDRRGHRLRQPGAVA